MKEIRLGLLHAEESYELRRLIEEIRKLGIKLVLRDWKSLVYGFSENGFEFKDGLEPMKRITHLMIRNGTITVRERGAVMQRNEFVRRLMLMGVYVLNGPALMNKEQPSKLWQANCFADKKVPSVTSEVFGSVEDVPKDYFSRRRVIKRIMGSMGKQVWLVDSWKDYLRLDEEFGTSNLLFQPYHPGGIDYRILVLGNSCLGAMKRSAADGEFRSNVSLGGNAEIVDLSDEMTDLALKASQAVLYEYAGVDLLPTDDGLKVLEVNRTAQFQGFEKATGVNVAKKIIEYLVSQ